MDWYSCIPLVCFYVSNKKLLGHTLFTYLLLLLLSLLLILQTKLLFLHTSLCLCQFICPSICLLNYLHVSLFRTMPPSPLSLINLLQPPIPLPLTQLFHPYALPPPLMAPLDVNFLGIGLLGYGVQSPGGRGRLSVAPSGPRV